MQLSAFVAAHRRTFLEELQARKSPSAGVYDEADLAQCFSLGKPQMGTVVYHPAEVGFEFIFSAIGGRSQVFTVHLPVPERIVFMPVPEWVVESIYQGEVDGTYRFESEMSELLSRFNEELFPGKNAIWFGQDRPRAKSKG